MQASISLSKLIVGRRNPRRTQPERDAHRRLVASIRTFDLLEPLVVRPDSAKPKHYAVIAGNRRLLALREVHRGEDPKVPCVVRQADDDAAEAMSLAENFIREPMHPLDEAIAFAKLASDEAKGVEAIAAQFGVHERYVRQRMKLATLAAPIRTAYREDRIDTAMAEAFAAVPPQRQLEVWKEVNEQPRHAEHVRNIINNAWIDASLAQFDVKELPEPAVSQDLFGQRVIVERTAFMEAQAKALEAERVTLAEEGWKEIVVGDQSSVQDRLWSMAEAEPEYDKDTTRVLRKIERQWDKLEGKLGKLDEGDEDAADEIQQRQEGLMAEAGRVRSKGTAKYDEQTKGAGSVFLILYPDGQVKREYRLPRPKAAEARPNGNGHHGSNGESASPAKLTSDDLSDGQLADGYTHQAIMVREALLGDPLARKRVLVMVLHDKVRSEALAIKHDANGATLHADHDPEFTSPALVKLRERRNALDPFHGEHYVDDMQAYRRLCNLSAKQLDQLIELLSVECVTCHMRRATRLVELLAKELAVDVRKQWRPAGPWLAGYQKVQLSHLLAELYGSAYDASRETRKKSELVAALGTLFADAAEGKFEDAKLAERANRWLPNNLRGEDSEDASAES